MKIAFLESFYGGSHKSFLDGLIQNTSHEIKSYVLPARFWKWRLRSSAIYFADQFGPEFNEFDLIMATDMINIAEFKALTNCSKPIIMFFHENQLTYPLPGRETIDMHFGFVNITSALTADLNLFNSEFQLSEFTKKLPEFLHKIPEFVPKNTLTNIVQKSQVTYMGCDFQPFSNLKKTKNDSPVILWNHRWEFDKQPHIFFECLYKLQELNYDFEVIILGENSQVHPKEFIEAKKRLSDRIIHIGFAECRDDYASFLARADIVISTAIQENFGFAVLEAMFCRALPLLPERLSYPEILNSEFHDDFLYKSQDDLLAKLKKYLTNINAYDDVRSKISASVAHFSWNDRIDDFDKIFDELLKKHLKIANSSC